MSVTERFGYWERGAAVLRSFGYPHEYGCPLCLRLFRRDQIDQLSLDHVPPKSVGSKLKVLTCKTCNSVAGKALDAHAYRYDVFRRILAGEPHPAVSARLTVAGGMVLRPLRKRSSLFLCDEIFKKFHETKLLSSFVW